MQSEETTTELDAAAGPDESPPPALWNPNAAANWSILLTPMFGAILHAKNWRALGQPERAKANRVWAGVTGVFVVAVLASFFVSHSESLDTVFRVAGLGLLIGWYFSQGKPQAKFVKEQLGNVYVKRGWGLPMLIGFGGLFVYFVVAMVLIVLTFAYSPEALKAEIEPVLLKDWRQTPGVSSATIESFTLKDVGDGMFLGEIEASINGEPVEYVIHVETTWDAVTWELE